MKNGKHSNLRNSALVSTRPPDLSGLSETEYLALQSAQARVQIAEKISGVRKCVRRVPAVAWVQRHPFMTAGLVAMASATAGFLLCRAIAPKKEPAQDPNKERVVETSPLLRAAKGIVISQLIVMVEKWIQSFTAPRN